MPITVISGINIGSAILIFREANKPADATAASAANPKLYLPAVIPIIRLVRNHTKGLLMLIPAYSKVMS